MSTEMYSWTRKSTLNLENHPDPDAESKPRTQDRDSGFRPDRTALAEVCTLRVLLFVASVCRFYQKLFINFVLFYSLLFSHQHWNWCVCLMFLLQETQNAQQEHREQLWYTHLCQRFVRICQKPLLPLIYLCLSVIVSK